jgi:hypothetical protein
MKARTLSITNGAGGRINVAKQPTMELSTQLLSSSLRKMEQEAKPGFIYILPMFR